MSSMSSMPVKKVIVFSVQLMARQVVGLTTIPGPHRLGLTGGRANHYTNPPSLWLDRR